MSPPTRNIRLIVAYRGTRYHGWQRQAEGVPTIQGCLEAAAGRILGHPVDVSGAGRTDAGVHAVGQVANLHTTNLAIPTDGFRRAMNSALPADIAIGSADEAPPDFHAARSAIGKTYRYRIYRRPVKPVMQGDCVLHYWRPLDPARMVAGAERLPGEHDFRGFADAAEHRENTRRRLTRCDVVEQEDELHVIVAGSGFLYRMVRNIVGTLIEIGRGRWEPDRVDAVLRTRDRALAGPTALPGGLCLVSVEYPSVPGH